eukprot:TRINITY_DN3948_c0_g1_i3.p1 TRINITY_DN3948_c0_g1~~TRINITY_DN3948_c0_g1_i3.p1  ORF type:complete len:204 (+),score=37.23 TRINITY_DN3948_c0_g1_i3:101-712(+)
MGCDGGTIPRRSEVVYVEQKKETVDKRSQVQARLTYCQISKTPLRSPVVVDPLGGLFNKVDILSALAKKELPKNLSHIKSLKDLVTVAPPSNPSYKAENEGNEELWICPITHIPCNNKHKFVVLRPCGCVLSLKATKEMAHDRCMVCEAELDKADPLIHLDPTAEQAASALKHLHQRQAALKAEKKRLKSLKPKEERDRKSHV